MSCSDNPLSLPGSHANGCIVYGMGFPFPLHAYRSALCGVSGAGHPTYGEIINGRHGVGLRPQAKLTGAIARVPMSEEERAVERGLDVLPHRHYPDRLPLPERWRRHARCGQPVPPAVVVIQAKIVLQGVGLYHRVMPLGEAKDD